MGISSLSTILSIMKTIVALLLLIVIVEYTQARYSYCQKPNEACLRNSDCCVGLCQAQLRSYYGFCTEPQPSIPFGSKTHLQLFDYAYTLFTHPHLKFQPLQLKFLCRKA